MEKYNEKGNGIIQNKSWKEKVKRSFGRILGWGMHKEQGIDGILVTVGLCIIALLLCVVMKDSLAGFIETIVKAMTEKANTILNGTAL